LKNALIAFVLIIVVILASTTKLLTNNLMNILPAEVVDNIPYNKIIILDAGHGGEDPGAIGVNGVYEKDLNLAIAMSLGEALINEGYAVIYTRTDDRMLYGEGQNIKGIRKLNDLKNRCNIAAEYTNALLISIHMNSFSNEKYDGFQAYYSEKNEKSLILANEITASVKEMIQPDNRRNVKASNKMYLLDNVSNPAVLLECGFLSNFSECEKLSEKEYQKQLSLAIVYGIINYRNKMLS
jgi:N-acetylmuramoyl-L-alanine amidase